MRMTTEMRVNVELPSEPQRSTVPRSLTLWLVAALTAALTLSPGPARAEVANGTRIADQSYPGIQLVVNVNTATLTVPQPELDPDALEVLYEQLVRQYLAGTIAPTDEAIAEALVVEMAKAPLTYLRPSNTTRSTEAQVGGLGTGFAITPDGTIITAAHVVKDDPEELKLRMAEAGLQTFVEEDVASFSQATDSPFTDAQRQEFAKMIMTFNANYLQLSEVTQTISVRFPEAAADGTKVGSLHPASVVSAGESYPGKDYAILKVDGVSNLPTIPVGDDSDIVAGSNFFVAGFTGASTFFPGASEDSQNQPALTEGPVTSVKSNSDGVPYFQTQAPAGHGNSGGPVMNDKGEAVGILVAGSVGQDGTLVEGQQWVLPMQVVQSELDNQSIEPETSSTTKVYNEALTDYYEQHYKNAIPKFDEAERLYPAHPYAKGFVQKSQSAINRGEDQTPLPLWIWAAIAGGVVIVLGGVGGGIALTRRGKAKRQQVAAAGGGQWPDSQGGPGQQWTGQNYQQPPAAQQYQQPPAGQGYQQSAPYQGGGGQGGGYQQGSYGNPPNPTQPLPYNQPQGQPPQGGQPPQNQWGQPPQNPDGQQNPGQQGQDNPGQQNRPWGPPPDQNQRSWDQ